MASLDYSKWDNLDSDDDDEAQPPSPTDGSPAQRPSPDSKRMPPGMQKIQQTPKGSEKDRHAFVHAGRTIYEWDQSLDEVNIWIKPPPGVTPNLIDILIQHSHLRVGIKGNPPFLNEDTGGACIVGESFWSMDPTEGEVTINLQKMRKGEMWVSALLGHGELDPLTKEEDKKRLMLERFAEENPGFDFSGAEFNGQIPEARSFMGGVKYT